MRLHLWLLAIAFAGAPRALAAGSGADDPGLIVRFRAAAQRDAGSPSSAKPRIDRLVERMAELAPRAAPAFPGVRAALDAGRTGARGGAFPAPVVLARAADLADIFVLRFTDARARDDAADRLAHDPDVLYVEPLFAIAVTRPGSLAGDRRDLDAEVQGGAGVVPEDSLYAEQWALPQIGMPEVWAGGTGTPGILVGIVDTGIEADHPDLSPNLAENALEAQGLPGIDDDENGFVDDIRGWNFLAGNSDVEDGFGHGSHIAGLIGAAADGRGTVGVTWQVGLLPVRMFDDAGRGTNLAGAQGITYAADRGAHIINMSWGTSRLSRVIEDAVAYASAAGAVLVASAGNSGDRITENFPAAFDQVIAVGATTATDAVAGFSNRGPRLDLVAPGVDILSTQRGGYSVLSGTSQSAALVSGVLAHLRYRHPELEAEELRSVLRLAALDLGRPGWDPAFGAGRLDAASALAMPSAPVAAISTPRTLDAVAGDWLDVVADALPGSGVAGVASYGLDIGDNDDPLVFMTVAEGSGGSSRWLGRIPLASRAEGELTVRLRVRDATQREAEDRVLIRIDRSAPTLLKHEHVDRLAGRSLEQLIRYVADEPVTGHVHLREAGTDGEFISISSFDGAPDHVALLSNLYPGGYEYVIDLDDYAGFTTRVDAGDGAFFVRDVIPLIDIPEQGYVPWARIPGFELGAVADLDQSGVPELLGEARGQGGAAQLTVLAISGLHPDAPEFDVIYRGDSGLPVAVRDVDGDGRPEVLVADDDLSLWSDLIAPGGPQVLWRSPLGDRRAGGVLSDVDGDQAIEVIFATVQGARLTAFEWNGSAFDSLDLGFTRPTRAAGFAAADYDGDGQGEIVLGSLAGELVAVEARSGRYVETVREPFLGGVANAITATHVGDGDGDGRIEFAISAVGALLDREQRPAIAVFEASGDDTYVPVSRHEFRDKNTPYDNALAAGDADGDDRPEIVVAQAGNVYLLDADRDDRFLPVWAAPRAQGGRVFLADLDGDAVAEILVTERIAEMPVTTIYSRAVAQEAGLVWEAVQHPLGNEIRWEAPPLDVEIDDLALYRLPEGSGSGLESDLAPYRIYTQPGELMAAASFRDEDVPPAPLPYLLAYTIDDGEVRLRVLEGPQAAQAQPGAPSILFLAPHPNPAPSAITIPIALAEPGEVVIGVYDVAGRLRRDLYQGSLPAGRTSLIWDGRDDQGHRLARGVYFVRTRSPLGEPSVRVVLLGS